MTAQTRPIRTDDLPTLLELNSAAVPAVNLLDEEAFGRLVGLSHGNLVVEEVGHQGRPLGFALTFLPGVDYDSENYRWFERRSSSFLYVDRIVIAEGFRGAGLGHELYARIFETAREAGCDEVFCEVNVEPPNPGSLAFHDRLGFAEIGRQATKGGSVVVALLARPTPA